MVLRHESILTSTHSIVDADKVISRLRIQEVNSQFDVAVSWSGDSPGTVGVVRVGVAISVESISDDAAGAVVSLTHHNDSFAGAFNSIRRLYRVRGAGISEQKTSDPKRRNILLQESAAVSFYLLQADNHCRNSTEKSH